MEILNNSIDTNTYNTAINVIGGLKDYTVILKSIDSYFSEYDSLDKLINQRNEFNLRTEKSRARIEREVENIFLTFLNTEHKVLINSIFTDRVPQQDKNFVLFWQFAINNTLFREISNNVFIKTYYSGRISISKDDIIAYLKEFLHQNVLLQISWSASTINMLATKYLNIMTKLGFLDTKRIKTFKYICPSSEAQVLFLYLAELYSFKDSNILDNELLPLSFIGSDNVLDRLKRLSVKGLFNMNFNGVSLNINLTHSSKGICDAIYK